MDKAKLAKLRAMGYEFDSAYDDAAERIEKSRADDVENKKKREETKLRVEKEKNENLIPQDFYVSFGYDQNIQRYLQAKHGYGLECNASTVMYLLQSYGLIAPNMSRKEFEYAFTPLIAQGSNKSDFISIGGKKQTVLPVDLFSPVLGEGLVTPVGFGSMKLSEAILRGVTDPRYPSPIRPNSTAIATINKIVDAFRDIKEKKGYNLSINKAIVKSKSNFKSLYTELKNSQLKSSYFKDGGVIYASISLSYASLACEHYVLIVAEAKAYIEKDSVKYYIYPIDDSWHEQSYLLVPNPFEAKIPITYWTEKANVLEKDGTLVYKGKRLFTISSAFAIGQ